MKYCFYFLLLLLSGCSSFPTTTPPINPYPSEHEYTNILELIDAANKAAPQGVFGIYTFRIAATDSKSGFVYLHTEQDPSNKNNIAIILSPDVVKQLNAQFKQDFKNVAVSQTIQVKGQVKRVTIDSEKSIYRTQIRIADIAQLTLLSMDSM